MKMLHEGLVWKISTGGASPLRGAGPWRSYSYIKRFVREVWGVRCPLLFVPGDKQFGCPPGDKHFSHTGGGGGDQHFCHTGGTNIFTLTGGGTNVFKLRGGGQTFLTHRGGGTNQKRVNYNWNISHVYHDHVSRELLCFALLQTHLKKDWDITSLNSTNPTIHIECLHCQVSQWQTKVQKIWYKLGGTNLFAPQGGTNIFRLRGGGTNILCWRCWWWWWCRWGGGGCERSEQALRRS